MTRAVCVVHRVSLPWPLFAAAIALVGSVRCASGRDGMSGGGPDRSPPQASARDAGTTGSACEGGFLGEASDASVTPLHGSATVEFGVSGRNEILMLETTLTVPGKSPANGTSFIWPGLQPQPAVAPVGGGVLQTVLTWGATCAPHAPSDPYESWWLSAEYVNPGAAAGPYAGCRGGEGASVDEGDALDVVMRRDGTRWVEEVVDRDNGRTATFDIDLAGQPQRRALFVIEQRDGASALNAVFSATRITFAEPSPAACQPAARGAHDAFSVPRVSPDGRTCCIERIALSSDGADRDD
jgi:hypothetical protein